MIILEKNITRDASLIAIQFWYEGATTLFKDFFNLVLFPEQLFLSKNGAFVFYRDNKRLTNELPRQLAKILETEPDRTEVIYKQLVESLEYFKNIKIDKQTTTQGLFKYLTEAKNKFALGFSGVFMTHWIPILHNQFIERGEQLFNDKLVQKIIKWREGKGNIFYNEGVSIIYLLLDEIAKKMKWDSYLIKYITYQELKQSIERQKLLPIKELKKRKNSTFAYMDNRIIFEPQLEKELKALAYKIKSSDLPEQITEIQGTSANQGQSKGKVKLVFSREHLNKVEEGDILVSPMTASWSLPAMKRSAAIITDEGGITCHAAIISRELNKPCIIGTKIASEVLNDNDLVEVDANKGVVRKLE